MKNPKTETSRSLGMRILTWGGTLFVLMAIWQVEGNTDSGRFLVSTPLAATAYATAHLAAVGKAFAYTLLEATAGLCGAVLFALAVGVIAVFKPIVTRLAHPFMVASQVVPFVCLAPLIILVFGPGVGGKIFLSSIMCFFPLVTGVLTAIRHAPRPHLEMMQLMNAPRGILIRHVLVPHAVPLFFSGLRVAAPFAVIGAIVAEFNGADWGVGKDLFISAKRLEPEMMMLGLLSGALASALLYCGVLWVESFLGSWHQHTKNYES